MRIVSQTIARFRPKRFSESPPLRPIVLTASLNVRHAHAFQATVFQDRCSELRISNTASEAGFVGHSLCDPVERICGWAEANIEQGQEAREAYDRTPREISTSQ